MKSNNDENLNDLIDRLDRETEDMDKEQIEYVVNNIIKFVFESADEY